MVCFDNENQFNTHIITKNSQQNKPGIQHLVRPRHHFVVSITDHFLKRLHATNSYPIEHRVRNLNLNDVFDFAHPLHEHVHYAENKSGRTVPGAILIILVGCHFVERFVIYLAVTMQQFDAHLNLSHKLAGVLFEYRHHVVARQILLACDCQLIGRLDQKAGHAHGCVEEARSHVDVAQRQDQTLDVVGNAFGRATIQWIPVAIQRTDVTDVVLGYE